MEKRLKCFPLLSLKEMCLRKVAVLLWSGSDILATRHFFKSEANWRDTIKDETEDKMLELDLPQSLTRQMVEINRPISLEIKKWLYSHKVYFLDSNGESIPPDVTKLCWTSAGAIDNRKTAEKLVRSDVLEIDKRYHLACKYCLEDDIPLLWEEVPEWIKIHYYNLKLTKPHPSYCWPYIFKGELSKLDHLLSTSDGNPISFYQCAFEYSAEYGYKTAAEYFFCKLSLEEREDSLARTVYKAVEAIKDISEFQYFYEFPKEKFSRLLFILSLMDPEYQMAILEAQPIDVLFCFLDWPWQDLFLENAGLFWTVLPPDSYGHLLWMIYARYSCSDFYVPILFRELFAQSPVGFKKYFVDLKSEFNSNKASDFLDLLFDSEDSETIGVIFRNLDAADRIKLIFRQDVLDDLYQNVMLGKWRVVNVCVREASLSKEDRERLKRTFAEYRERYFRKAIYFESRNLKRFFEFLDEFDASAVKKKKRKLIDASAVKKKKRKLIDASAVKKKKCKLIDASAVKKKKRK